MALEVEFEEKKVNRGQAEVMRQAELEDLEERLVTAETDERDDLQTLRAANSLLDRLIETSSPAAQVNESIDVLLRLKLERVMVTKAMWAALKGVGSVRKEGDSTGAGSGSGSGTT